MISLYLTIFYAISLGYKDVFGGEAALKCPKMCTCQGLISIKCSKLSANDIEDLYRLLQDHRYTELLQNLSITFSALKDLNNFPNFNQLIYLDLSNNEIIHTDTPKPFSISSVVFLDLRYNNFNSINRDSFLMFPNVEEVHLEHNKIFSIDWEAFRLFKLKKLYISHNYLPTVSEHMLRFTPNLEVLDLSYNQLAAAQSSSFFSAQRLSYLDLSHNRLQRFDYDSFSPLYQLETLDLSFNNFSQIPGGDLRQMIGLRVLNFSGNPIEKIAAGDFVQPVLQVLDLSYCQKLRLVESRAFLKMPNLHTVNLSNNPSLVYISPNAFENNTLIFEIKITNSSLENIDSKIISDATIVSLNGNPLKCGCIKDMVEKYGAHIGDLNKATCTTKSGNILRLKQVMSGGVSDECRPEPLLPFGGSLVATVGEYFSMYCAPKIYQDSLLWTFPNGTQVMANQTEVQLPSPFADSHTFFTSPHHSSNPGGIYARSASFSRSISAINPPQPADFRPRILATKEQLRFDAILQEDAGEYKCTVKHNGGLSHRKVQLAVIRPNIALYTLEVGSHYIALAWNDSLKIRTTDRVRLYLNVKDSIGLTSRAIQLSMHNPWYSYNVMRLKPDQNYTFCLTYLLSEYGKDKFVYESCLYERTLPNLSFWTSLNLSTIITFFVVLFIIFSLLCFRAIYFRFHLWHQAKYRARMNQSLSGQSFLSRTSSANGHAISNSVTFENTSQLGTSHSMYRFSIASTNNNNNIDYANGRLLTTVQDAAV